MRFSRLTGILHKQVSTGRAWLALALGTLGAGCAGAHSSVTRLVDGVVIEGRQIPPEAYAYYGRAASLEAQGDLAGALALFKVALDADPESPEILARIGALECARARAASDEHAQRARKSLERALTLDPVSSTALSESARCRARLGETEAALDAALAAARADPDSIPIQILVVDLAEATNSLALARQWLDALVARTPSSREAWLRFSAFAERHGDVGRGIRAGRALEGLQAARSPLSRERALEDAFRANDLPGARRAAVSLRIPPGDLAARAALRGAWTIARAQAELVLAADPTDADAWVALMAVQDVSRNAEGWAETLRAAPKEPATTPSPAARRLQAELLDRVVGRDARRAWDGAF